MLILIVSGLAVFAAYSAVKTARHLGDTSTGVPCKEAVEFAMAKLPERATNTKCESYGVMDRSYRGTWQMPQPDVDTWLAQYFPDRVRPPATDIPSSEPDLRVTVHRDPMAETTQGAYDITLDIHFTPDGTAHVSYSSTDY